MLNRIIVLSIIFSFSLLANIVNAAANLEPQPVNAATKQKILSYVSKIIPSKPTLIQKSPIDGLYMVMFEAKLLFVSIDGRYVFESSSLMDLKDRSNFSEKMVNTARKKMLAEVDPKTMIVYSPPKTTKHTITVFTDIDCPYCQKLHLERNKLLQQGVKIRYLMYPRAGVNSISFQVAESVWCSKDQKAAMTLAKKTASSNSRARRSGAELKPLLATAKCTTPVRQQMALLSRLDMEGSTPQILLDSGELIRGYLPAAELMKIINK